jgi:hypothetical protein
VLPRAPDTEPVTRDEYRGGSDHSEVDPGSCEAPWKGTSTTPGVVFLPSSFLVRTESYTSCSPPSSHLRAMVPSEVIIGVLLRVGTEYERKDLYVKETDVPYVVVDCGLPS